MRVVNCVGILFLLHCSWRETMVFRGSAIDWKSDQIIYIVSKEKYRAICVMNIDGTNVQEMYRDYSKALLSGLTVSRDGRWLAFRRGNIEILGVDRPYGAAILYLLNLNDFTIREIEREHLLLLMSQRHYSWSSNRNLIVYTDLSWNVYLYDAETSTKGIVVRGDSSPSGLYFPRWSPDGTNIAGVNVAGVYVVNLNTLVPSLIYSSDDGLGPIDVMDWVTEQEVVLYPSYPAMAGLCKIDVRKREASIISDLNTVEVVPSPDRQVIAVVQTSSLDAHAPLDINVMKIDGSDHRKLAKQKGWNDNFNPCWSTDGTYIVFASTLHTWDRSRSEIYIMDADGQNQKRLTFTEDGNCYNPVWVSRYRKEWGQIFTLHKPDFLDRRIVCMPAVKCEDLTP